MTGSRDVAVIDVGSNSIRLVLYRVDGRAIWTVFNEKVLAGLGRDMTATGRLAPDGVDAALGALRRFRAVLDNLKPAEIFTAATAAVREARDRQDFLGRVRTETGFRLRVLKGEEEARLSALGVLAGAPDSTGVVGDLGGSSLELIRVEQGRAGEGVTLPLGPFALGAPDRFEKQGLSLAVRAVLAPMASRFETETFHAVGGAWRNLALVHMNRARYPLHVVHQYEMTAAEALETAHLIAHQSRASLEGVGGVSKKRAETLPYAALVLEALIQQLGVKRLSISAYGLREGLIYEAMADAVRARDPLLEGCAALATRHAVAVALGPALETWLRPFWRDLDPVFPAGREAVLVAAACRLCDIGARLHPDHRADLVFEQVLRAPIAGQTHAERAFLAIAAFNRHTAATTNPEPEAIARTLNDERLARARALGAAMRLGCDLSGRSADLLAASRLSRAGNEVTLSVKPGSADILLGEQTTKRAGQLAEALAMTLKVKSR